MITMIIALRRNPNVSHEFFVTEWRDGHGPLVMTLPEFSGHLLSYRQFYLVDYDQQTAANGWGGGQAPAFDGVAILSFADAETMQVAFSQPRFLSIAAPDADRFTDIPHSDSYLARLISSDALPKSHHGGVSLFEFAAPGAPSTLLDWAGSAPAELTPISADQYQSLANDDADSSSPTPQVQLGPDTASSLITVCAFASAETAKEALAALAERNATAGHPKLTYALALEHCFI